MRAILLPAVLGLWGLSVWWQQARPPSERVVAEHTLEASRQGYLIPGGGASPRSVIAS